MTTEMVFFSYVALTLGGIGTLSFYDRQRQKRFGPSPSEDRIFKCEKCGFVYTDDADVDRSRCLQCGTLNESIKF
jgi:hypothetical protein